MQSIQSEIARIRAPRGLWLLHGISIILASSLAAVLSLVFLPFVSFSSWGIMLIYAALAGLSAGILIWRPFVMKAKHATIKQGILYGILSSIIAHPLMWTYTALSSFIGIGGQQWGVPFATFSWVIFLSIISLLYVGWITIAVGALFGALLIWLQRALIQHAQRRDMPAVEKIHTHEYSREKIYPLEQGRTIPFSKLVGRGRIGADFFQRINAVEEMNDPPRGLIDDISELCSAHFLPEELHPDIRAFYERTEQFSLFVRAHWKFGLPGARLYKFFSSRIGQLNFPLEDACGGELLESRILPIKRAVDGRAGVRAWVRTYKQTDQAMYLAAYTTHTQGARKYMNIAFPVPGGNITCILRVIAMSADDVLLTSVPLHKSKGDEGVYLVKGSRFIRLPTQETIHVWVVGSPGIPTDLEDLAEAATLVARHEVWLFGTRFLTLDYRIYPL